MTLIILFYNTVGGVGARALCWHSRSERDQSLVNTDEPTAAEPHRRLPRRHTPLRNSRTGTACSGRCRCAFICRRSRRLHRDTRVVATDSVAACNILTVIPSLDSIILVPYMKLKRHRDSQSSPTASERSGEWVGYRLVPRP